MPAQPNNPLFIVDNSFPALYLILLLATPTLIVITTTTPFLTSYVPNDTGEYLTLSRDIHKLTNKWVDRFINQLEDIDCENLFMSTEFVSILFVTA